MRKCIVFFIFCISILTLFAQKRATGYTGVAVDLGLPSGTKWADRNIGASSATEYGNYFSWDEVSNKQWGGTWHAPSKEQFDELLANTTRKWTIVNGVKGYKFTAKNGKWIFFPAKDGGLFAPPYGNYWSRSINVETPYLAYFLKFDSDSVKVGEAGRGRYEGLAVRPVRP